MIKKQKPITKTEVKKKLNSYAFDPNTLEMGIIGDVDDIRYYQYRAMEFIHEGRIDKAIQYLVIGEVKLDKRMEEFNKKSLKEAPQSPADMSGSRGEAYGIFPRGDNS